jgi:nucleotide-binding universal stress UspA family protein
MSRNIPLNSILVPLDFSPASLAAVEWALNLVAGTDPTVMLVHVIDSSLVHTMEEHGFGTREEVARRLRLDAEQKLEEMKAGSVESPKIITLICEGVPFLEIIQKANDFAVDAVVMSKIGQRRQFETLLFGSTAEKVARGCRQPIIVLPSTGSYET